MLWILYAVLAHAGNALVFVVDKSLLSTGRPIAQPVRYAAYSGLVAAGAAVLLAFVYVAPTGFIIQWSLIAGAFWVAALWLFFVALKGGEPSRVVPVAGSAVPVFTLIFASLFLGERLVAGQLMAVVILIAGGALLSVQLGRRRGTLMVLGAAVLSGAAFAAHFAVADFIYQRFDPFLAAFAYTRLGVGAVALILLVVLMLPGPSQGSTRRDTQAQKMTLTIAVAFFGSKLLAAGALILQNYAISLGSVTVVNALQGTQYLVLLILAVAVTRFAPRLFREELSRVSLWQKVSGILLIGLGLVLLVSVR